MNDVGYPDGFLATAEAVAELPSPCSYEYSYRADVCDEPTCPTAAATSAATATRSCTDGDDDYCCGADYYCERRGRIRGGHGRSIVLSVHREPSRMHGPIRDRAVRQRLRAQRRGRRRRRLLRDDSEAAPTARCRTARAT